jgi:GNAT superfamily N-acetyltransferase
VGERSVGAARPPEREEMGDLCGFLDGVFRGEGGSMAEDYPRLLCERNRPNLRVVAESRRIVSHAGIVLRDALVEGTGVSVACLGSVATARDFRGRGHASACVVACLERAGELGAHVMWISGERDLYRRLGARVVGCELEFELSLDALGPLAREDPDVRRVTEGDLPDAAALYSLETVRFIRPLEDWEAAFGGRFGPHRGSCFLGCWEPGGLSAYVLLRPADEKGATSAVEYAGARGVLLGSLAAALEEAGARLLRLRVPRTDVVLTRRLEAAGFEGRLVPAEGTALIIDFTGLMERLRGRFLERAGEQAASQLSFSEEGPPLGPDNRFRVACGPDVMRIEGRGALAELIFGTSERPAETCAPGGPRLRFWGAEAPFRAALPMPAIRYGLNYV